MWIQISSLDHLLTHLSFFFSPRDAITISRSFSDTSTFIDISTSLPRSPDEPAYLRPSPPFVRSHVKRELPPFIYFPSVYFLINCIYIVFVWCIQHIQPQPSPTSSADPKKSTSGRLRLTCFCQHDLKALWGFGYSVSALTQQLSTMTLSLLKTVMKRGPRVPKLIGYGNGVSIGRIRYQLDREALTVDYTILPDDEDHNSPDTGPGLLLALRENRRLTRTLECVLPSLSGWDVQVTMKGSDEEVEKLPWSTHASRNGDSSNPSNTVNALPLSNQILFRVAHTSLTSANAVLKVKLVIEFAGSTRGLRVNGLAKSIHSIEERDPSSLVMPQRILQDVASVQGLSFGTLDSAVSESNAGSSSSSMASVDAVSGRPLTMERSAAAEKSILSKVRRNYIYFSSLLQEPEAKWRRSMCLFSSLGLHLLSNLSQYKQRRLEGFLLRNLILLILPLLCIERRLRLWVWDCGISMVRWCHLEQECIGISSMRMVCCLRM